MGSLFAAGSFELLPLEALLLEALLLPEELLLLEHPVAPRPTTAAAAAAVLTAKKLRLDIPSLIFSSSNLKPSRSTLFAGPSFNPSSILLQMQQGRLQQKLPILNETLTLSFSLSRAIAPQPRNGINQNCVFFYPSFPVNARPHWSEQGFGSSPVKCASGD